MRLRGPDDCWPHGIPRPDPDMFDDAAVYVRSLVADARLRLGLDSGSPPGPSS